MEGQRYACPLCGRLFPSRRALHAHARRVVQALVARGLLEERRTAGSVMYLLQPSGEAALGVSSALELVKKHYPHFSCDDLARKGHDPPLRQPPSLELLHQAGKIIGEMLSRQRGTEAHLSLRKILRAIGLPSSSYYMQLCIPLFLSVAPPPWRGEGVRRGGRGLTLVFSRAR
ncbi:MAG: hypothetical protein QXZ31_05620 [Thermofilaceae archaeon]